MIKGGGAATVNSNRPGQCGTVDTRPIVISAVTRVPCEKCGTGYILMHNGARTSPMIQRMVESAERSWRALNPECPFESLPPHTHDLSEFNEQVAEWMRDYAQPLLDADRADRIRAEVEAMDWPETFEDYTLQRVIE